MNNLTASSWNPENSLGGLVSSLSYTLRKVTTKSLLEQGMGHLTFPKFWAMHLLRETPSNQTVLCQRLGQSAPSIMEMLDRLQADGLVKFEASVSDPRRKIWSLTAKGQRDYDKAQNILRNVGRQMDKVFSARGVSPSELNRTREILAMVDSHSFSPMTNAEDPDPIAPKPANPGESKITGIAHLCLTVNNYKRCAVFYRKLFSFWGMKCVFDGKDGMYFIGGKTAVAVGRGEKRYQKAKFIQTRIGLHHVCFRARSRNEIEQTYQFLKKQKTKIVRAPEPGPWAEGYYSILFEDPDGIRLELNHVPGKGLLEPEKKFNPAGHYR